MNENPLIRALIRTGLPKPPRSASPAEVCGECGQEIYIGEYVYVMPGGNVCPDCAAEYIAGIPLAELADRLGFVCRLLTLEYE
jgi:hypothetical protein